MGLVASTVRYIFGWEDADLDVADEATGLTKREKRAITNSWTLVRQDLKVNGVKLFIGFFKAYPSNQDFFSSFKGKDLEKVEKSAALRVHGTSVMHALNSVVDNLDDPECLVGLLQKNAATHFHRGIRIQQYKELFEVLPIFLKDRLGDSCTDDTLAAWGKAGNVMISVIEEELTKQSNMVKK